MEEWRWWLLLLLHLLAELRLHLGNTVVVVVLLLVLHRVQEVGLVLEVMQGLQRLLQGLVLDLLELLIVLVVLVVVLLVVLLQVVVVEVVVVHVMLVVLLDDVLVHSTHHLLGPAPKVLFKLL